jgi:hypothetical protein
VTKTPQSVTTKRKLFSGHSSIDQLDFSLILQDIPIPQKDLSNPQAVVAFAKAAVLNDPP